MIRMNRELRSDLENTNDLIDRADFTLSLSLFLSLSFPCVTHLHKNPLRYSMVPTGTRDEYDKVWLFCKLILLSFQYYIRVYLI